MKRKISIIVCLLLLCSCILSISCSADASISPYLNNVAEAETNFSIDENGNATIVVSYTGYPGITTGADIKVTMEKRFLLLFWNDVETWNLKATGEDYITAITKSVGSGTYRVRVEFTIYGYGGAADVFTTEHKYTH